MSIISFFCMALAVFRIVLKGKYTEKIGLYIVLLPHV